MKRYARFPWRLCRGLVGCGTLPRKARADNGLLYVDKRVDAGGSYWLWSVYDADIREIASGRGHTVSAAKAAAEDVARKHGIAP